MNRFLKSEHKYIADSGIELLSVTKWLGTFTRPFNANIAAHMSAKKQGISTDEVLDLWDLKRDIANNYGNAIHQAIELWVKYGIEPTQEHLLSAVRDFQSKEVRDIIGSEYRIFDTTYNLGGTVDLLTSDKIIDFKTNDTMKKGKGRFLEPLRALQVSNLNKARLQLSVYNHLLGGNRELEIWHWDGEQFNIIPIEQVDVSEILESRKQEIEKLKIVDDMF